MPTAIDWMSQRVEGATGPYMHVAALIIERNTGGTLPNMPLQPTSGAVAVDESKQSCPPLAAERHLVSHTTNPQPGVYSNHPPMSGTMDQPIPGVHSDPELLGGTPVFVGTRVPVRALLDYLEHDRPLAEFLDDFPTVDRALAIGVLEHLKHVVSHASAAR